MDWFGAQDVPHGGRRCAVIKRSPDRHYGEVYGESSQKINAAQFREQQLRLQAAVRVEGVMAVLNMNQK